MQPSSAASERVFPLLQAAFHEQHILQDYFEASVILHYNKRFYIISLIYFLVVWVKAGIHYHNVFFSVG